MFTLRGTFEAVVQPTGGEGFEITLGPAILVRQGTENERLTLPFDFDPFRVDPQRFGNADGLRASRGEDAGFHFRIYVYPESRFSKEKTGHFRVSFSAFLHQGESGASDSGRLDARPSRARLWRRMGGGGGGFGVGGDPLTADPEVADGVLEFDARCLRHDAVGASWRGGDLNSKSLDRPPPLGLTPAARSRRGGERIVTKYWMSLMALLRALSRSSSLFPVQTSKGTLQGHSNAAKLSKNSRQRMSLNSTSLLETLEIVSSASFTLTAGSPKIVPEILLAFHALS